MDRNDYYGAESASLNLTQVSKGINKRIEHVINVLLCSFITSLDLTKSQQSPWVVIVIGTLI